MGTLILAIAFLSATPASAKDLLGCIRDALRPKSSSSMQDYQSFALKANELKFAAFQLEDHFSEVRQDFVGGGGRPFALQGLPPAWEAPEFFQGKVLRASEVQNVFKNGIPAASSGGELWFTQSPTEALQYGIYRATQWNSANPDDKWVIAVMRIDRSRLLPGTKLSQHVRPHENPNALTTHQDIPASAVSHVFVLNPQTSGMNPRFQTISNPTTTSP